MLATLTPDPVLDQAYFIPAWTPGSLMRAEKTTVSVGGKGLDASVALSHLGVRTRAFCFLGGETGVRLLKRLRDYDIQLQPIWAEGETRTALIIVEESQQRHSHLFSGGLQIRPEAAEALLDTLEGSLADTSWLVCGGVLPLGLDPDFYARAIQVAHRQGKPVLIDSFGQHLIPALAVRPEVVKMNWKEFEGTFQVTAPELETLFELAKEIRQNCQLPALVITCGRDGILGITDSGSWLACPPAQTVVNAAGAGDAVSGVLAWRLGCDPDWPEALRWATAAGAAVVLTDTTADLRRNDFERILPRVKIEQLG